MTEWLQREKAKRAARKAGPHDGQSKLTSVVDATKSFVSRGHVDGLTYHKARRGRARSPSSQSDTSLALEDLEHILAESMKLDGEGIATPKDETKGPYFSRRGSGRRRTLRKTSTVASSDTDYQDGDALVPSAEVVLDNSKTLGYSGGAAEFPTNSATSHKRSLREKEAWLHFKKVNVLPT